MEGMRDIPDKYFELAIVDPPYGIDAGDQRRQASRTKLAKATDYHYDGWDKEPPSQEYFTELMRVSQNQIIWGCQYFVLPRTSCVVVWDKDNSGDFADCEVAWASFGTAARLFKYRWNGMLQHKMANKEKRIHPTQKPVDLYKWLLHNYAKPGEKILDTHVGSGSSIIACIDKGFEYMGFEIDADYYKAMQDRIYQFTRQTTLRGMA
jgi:site-specific DNA-methyltransferase (adenine-specific)